MKKLAVKLHRVLGEAIMVGTLAEQDRRIYFEYDPFFLRSELELSPFKLPTQPGLIEHTDHAFGLLPGLFDDSLPDGWGLLLMDRHFRREGIDPAALSPLDRLAYLGTRTMGALTYHPPQQMEHGNPFIDLHELGRNAEEVLAGESAEVLPQLEQAGGSPGGARPKVLVGIQGDQIISGENNLPEDFLASGGEHWIVKFAAKENAHNAGPVEYAYALMSTAAGIDMPPVRLFEVRKNRAVRRYFGVKRFDRTPNNGRIHVHTFANLIHANFRIPSTDYADLLKVTRTLARNHQDVLRLFRLMIFNIVAHNRDDHAKNFAFMLNSSTGEWSLTPAYDLTFSPGPGGEHSTTILGEGRCPTREQCIKLAEQVDIKAREAMPIIDEVNAAICQWRDFADQAGCTSKIIATIRKAHCPL